MKVVKFENASNTNYSPLKMFLIDHNFFSLKTNFYFKKLCWKVQKSSTLRSHSMKTVKTERLIIKPNFDHLASSLIPISTISIKNYF